MPKVPVSSNLSLHDIKDQKSFMREWNDKDRLPQDDLCNKLAIHDFITELTSPDSSIQIGTVRLPPSVNAAIDTDWSQLYFPDYSCFVKVYTRRFRSVRKRQLHMNKSQLSDMVKFSNVCKETWLAVYNQNKEANKVYRVGLVPFRREDWRQNINYPHLMSTTDLLVFERLKEF